MSKISSPAEELLACQEELCSVQLGITAFRQCLPVATVCCASHLERTRIKFRAEFVSMTEKLNSFEGETGRKPGITKTFIWLV